MDRDQQTEGHGYRDKILKLMYGVTRTGTEMGIPK